MTRTMWALETVGADMLRTVRAVAVEGTAPSDLFRTYREALAAATRTNRVILARRRAEMQALEGEP